MFVEREEDCLYYCQMTEGCRYWWWYPIERSESPQYCYLFQQCAAKDTEPEVLWQKLLLITLAHMFRMF